MSLMNARRDRYLVSLVPKSLLERDYRFWLTACTYVCCLSSIFMESPFSKILIFYCLFDSMFMLMLSEEAGTSFTLNKHQECIIIQQVPIPQGKSTHTALVLLQSAITDEFDYLHLCSAGYIFTYDACSPVPCGGNCSFSEGGCTVSDSFDCLLFAQVVCIAVFLYILLSCACLVHAGLSGWWCLCIWYR